MNKTNNLIISITNTIDKINKGLSSTELDKVVLECFTKFKSHLINMNDLNIKLSNVYDCINNKMNVNEISDDETLGLINTINNERAR